MGCSCCGSTEPSQADTRMPEATDSSSLPLSDVPSTARGYKMTDSVDELNIASNVCCEESIAPPATMRRDDSYGRDSVRGNTGEIKDSSGATALPANARTCSDHNIDPSDCCKGKSWSESPAGNCCNDQSAEAVDRIDLHPRDASLRPCRGEDTCPTQPTLRRSNESLDSPCADCCSSPRQPSLPLTPDDTDRPDCCRGKSSPCCDDACLDRLALRECDATSDCVRDWAEHSTCSLTATAKHDDTFKRRACDRHQYSVREQYGASLAALGCICRALLDLGRESCCGPRVRSSLEGQKCSKRSRKQSPSGGSNDSCCASSIASGRSLVGSISQYRKPRSRCGSGKDDKRNCSAKPCCEPDKATPIGGCERLSPSKDFSHSSEMIPRPADTGSNTCCTLEEPSSVKRKSIRSASRLPDPESQASGVEHVILSISGMTCTGCETKLSRTLATVTGVKNLKTSLVLSRAEFDLDLSLSTVDSVVKNLERTTEFKCEAMTRNGSTLDVIVSEDAATFANRPWPEGVTEISLVDQHLVRVVFDPEIIGARDLIEGPWAGLASLAPVHGDPALVAESKHVRRVGFLTLLSALFTVPVLVLAWAPIPGREIVYGSVSLGLATLVQVAIAGPFYPMALKALVFSRVIEMDLLIVLSTSVAYVFSVISFGYSLAGRPLSTGQFFETSTLLVTLIMFGRYVAALARHKAVKSISIRSLQANYAILVDSPNSPEGREVDARLLQYGDYFRVIPDTKIPTDGTVVSGFSEVDESMLTGESRSVEKHTKSNIIAGTINGPGTLVARLTRLPGDNTINAIAAMVDEAKLSKPKMQALADKVSSYFVPAIVALTIITFAVWTAVGMAVQHKTGSEAAVQAITYAIAVLIISCPCAIGLAVPMVVVIVSGIASRRGVIFKSASAFELARKTSHVVLDKTGTLTQGRLSVAVEHYTEHGRSRLSLLHGLISNSKHPVSLAVGNHLKSQGVAARAVPDAINLTGCGVEAQLAGQALKAGNARWLGLLTHPLVEPVLGQGYTTFCFTIDGLLCAVFGLEDSLRDDAAQLVTDLQTRGVSVHVVSGDDEGPVQSVATKLGISESNVRARSSPADKQTYIKTLLSDCSGVSKPVVIFCGDGTNDAVALAQATIGIHINEGSDVAQSAADIVLMRPDLSCILTVINASKVSVQRIKFNFGWSVVYNTFAVLLAAGAFVNTRIPPEFAGLGELVSVLPVIAAAVLLRWSKI